MRRRFLTAALLTLTLCSLFSQGGAGLVESQSRVNNAEAKAESGEPTVELIDIRANLVYPYDINDTLSVLILVGDFAAHHNGAVITADSAVRYGDDRLECFGKVLINQNTTYAYADRADYNGKTNVASLYSPMVKVVDEDVTLYTYNFSFNTQENVGRYWGGGVTTKRGDDESGDVEMESIDGYYYGDLKRVVGVGEVELRGEGYEMDGDSVIYEMEAERAYFFDNTNIWNEKGEYLYGDLGIYDKTSGVYRVTKSAYMLTAEQEIWSDSMEYRRDAQEATLWENIQIDDTTHKNLAFGDYGRYWRDVERVLLTREPLVINYDPQEVDSLFLRADTIQLLSYPLGTGPIVDSVEIKRMEELKARMAAATQSVVSDGGEVDSEVLEEVEEILEEQKEQTRRESNRAEADSVALEEAEAVHDHDHDHDHDHSHHKKTKRVREPKDSTRVSFFDRVKLLFKGDSTAKAERRLKFQQKSDEKAAAMEKRRLADLDAYKAREYRKLSERCEKLETRIDKRLAKGRSIYSDSMVLLRVRDELNSIYDTVQKRSLTDSLAVIDSLRNLIASMKEEKVVERDSLYRVAKAYRNVRSYRSDFQMVCDSLVAISYDSTMRLYISPIIWNESNQITAQQVDLYTLDGALDYADFTGNPIMAAEVVSGDSIYYNQIKGKTMKTLFENNEVRQNDVDGNVQTIYFLEDDDTGLVNTISKIESGAASFYVENQQLSGVTYRTTPTYVFAPLTKVPADLPYTLDGFGWHADIRPVRDSLVNRVIRPTLRMAKDTLPRPAFPLTDSMRVQRAELERKRVWFDRRERVSPDVARWMEDLGYKPGQPREGGNPF